MKVLKQIGKKFFSENKDGKLFRYLTILGMLGIFLLMISSNLNHTKNDLNINESKTGTDNNMKVSNIKMEYVEKLENDLEDLLSVMKNVGRSKVKIILERGNAYEFKYNNNKSKKTTSETDSNGGKREIIEEDIEQDMVIIRKSDGSEKPVIKTEYKPIVKGVLIIAEGATDYKIKYKITKSVSNLFDIPLYKVNVLPLQGR